MNFSLASHNILHQRVTTVEDSRARASPFNFARTAEGHSSTFPAEGTRPRAIAATIRSRRRDNTQLYKGRAASFARPRAQMRLIEDPIDDLISPYSTRINSDATAGSMRVSEKGDRPFRGAKIEGYTSPAGSPCLNNANADDKYVLLIAGRETRSGKLPGNKTELT